MKKRIISCFSKGAKEYDNFAVVQAIIADELSKKLHVYPAKKILEIGCGTGLFTQRLMQKFPESSYHLTDISPTMIATINQKFGNKAKIIIECLDGENLSSQISYDLIVSSMTLHWFNKLEISLKKITKHLKPNGKFIFAMLGSNSLIEWRNICEKHDIPIATPRLPDVDILKNRFSTWQFETKVLEHTYLNLHAFLSSMKKVGAHATIDNYLPITPLKLRPLLRKFKDKITISYEVILGSFDNAHANGKKLRDRNNA